MCITMYYDIEYWKILTNYDGLQVIAHPDNDAVV